MMEKEYYCVGEMEIVKAAKPPASGFLIGSIPVSVSVSVSSSNNNNNNNNNNNTSFASKSSSALVPSSSPTATATPGEGAPRYRVIPTQTNLNTLPPPNIIPHQVLPLVASPHSPAPTPPPDLPYESGAIASNLRRKGEALAVSGLTEYEDEIDVIAPADILKQIFKIPYSRARLSIAVHRIGQSLILNTGPDVEEGEKLVRRHKQAHSAEKSLFWNFAMHSVRMEACDCPSSQSPQSEEPLNSSFPPGNGDCDTSEGHPSPYFGHGNDSRREETFECSDYSQAKKESFFLGGKKKQRNKERDAVNKVSQVKEKPEPSMQESDMYRRMNQDGFLRVLFWKFNNLRMFLGSDLLIFSNEKYAAVSLHLWDISRQVTPLTWLEAWLDNVMASVPELAICYHKNGVVQGYELLKTDDIFLSKGVSEDGTPAFLPHIVRQNGHSVLRFLQENCKQDPGAYWLYKNAGEDNIQLFDLSVVPKSHATNSCDDDCGAFIPSLINRGRSDSLLSLGTLLYRVAHRLSLSVSPHNRARCASLLKKCLDFLDQPDQLVVRAFAHEQFARLLLDYDEDLDLTSEVLSLVSEETVVHAEEEPDERFNGFSELIIHDYFSPNKEDECGRDAPSRKLLDSNETESSDAVTQQTCNSVVQANVDPISSKLAAIHHVSQAIKSLRWTRQLQGSENYEKPDHSSSLPIDFSVCACGDTDCIEVCDIRKWLPTSKLDDKLWKLVLLLGESYLSLGEAYIDDGQSHQAFKVVRLACLVYGSMPQHLEDSRFISSMSSSSFEIDIQDTKSIVAHYLFWAKAWTLVGDVYVEFHLENQKEMVEADGEPPARELQMSPEVQKELERLKKKLGKFYQSCSSCSLVNCSCQSDRASSGSSASSSSNSSSNNRPLCGKKHSEKPFSRSLLKNPLNGIEVEKSSKETESSSTETKLRNGGIFRYLHGYDDQKDVDHNLTSALDCYEEAMQCLNGHSSNHAELQSLSKKKGWVCNELGRRRLERKEISKAEQAFSVAISSFKQVSDHKNIILINMNLGHGRRAAAEEIVSQLGHLRNHLVFSNAFNQKLEAAKLQYGESLRFYRAAKKEVDASDAMCDISNEVYTQFAHTYLRLGMLLARENTTAKVYKFKKEFGKHEISPNDALSEALSMYELLGDLRKQEAAYAYFQLAFHQRDCCLRFLEMDLKKSNISKGEKSVLQRVKQYASMAERNWQKSLQFYGPKTHSTMYLTILIEKTALLCSLSKLSHAYVTLESALNSLLEGRHVPVDRTTLQNDDCRVYERFWSQLQMTLKSMLAITLPASTKKSVVSSQQTVDVKKLKELYKLSLNTTDFSQLHAIYRLWVS